MSERLHENNLTVAELSQIRGEPWTKIVRYMVPFKNEINIPEPTESLLDISVPRSVYIHFDFVTETDIPADDWLTTSAMAQELDVFYGWVNRRLLFLEAPAEFRLSRSGSRLHLHPDALDELEEIRSRSTINIDLEKYMNLEQLSEALGRHRLWVSNRLEAVDAQNVLGLDPSGKSVVYYDIGVLEFLLQERDRFAEAGEMLTIPMIAQRTGKDREWVEVQIEDLGLIPELRRFEKSGRIDICFHPSQLKELFESLQAYKSAPEEWFTKNAIVAIVGKSRNWVHKRLENFDSEAVLFEDSQGVLRKHYPPGVLDRLVNIANGWQIVNAMKDSGQREADDAGKFRKVFELYGTTVSLNSLFLMGVTRDDIEAWTNMKLMTRWSNGQYYFTREAARVVERIRAAEDQVRRLHDLSLWLEEV